MTSTPLTDLARLFLRLGATAFGGPAAHIAMMRDEVVSRRRWLRDEEFLDYLGATNLIPGPNSTEMAIHIGRGRAGWRGLVVAGACFILPAALIVGILAALYVRYASLPDVDRVLYGIKAVVIAVVANALWGLGRSALKNALAWTIAACSVVALAIGIHELVVLAAAGVLMALVRRSRASDRRNLSLVLSLMPAPVATTATSFGLWPLFLLFAKIGSVLFGSGYVLIAFLRADLVVRLRWLTEQQLLDAVAAGQITPGPLFTTATFIGYVLGGIPGAIVATAGIFLPAFVFVAASGPLIPRIRQSPVAGAVLDGVNAASLAMMVVVLWQLGRAALVDVPAIGIAALSLAGLAIFRVNAMWLIAVGAVAGYLLRGFRL